MKQFIPKALALMLMLPGLALAHTGAGETTGFMHGLLHPVGGADHLLAMVAVGLWAAQIGGRALWLIPGTFIGLMMLGGLLGFSGIVLPFIEAGILASVLILGVLVAGAFRLPLLSSALLVGLFAFFHGQAHGEEIPAAIGMGSYTLGFALSTALLHATGMSLGMLLRHTPLHTASRFAGGAVALSSIYLAIH